jgi:hypothetical protein
MRRFSLASFLLLVTVFSVAQAPLLIAASPAADNLPAVLSLTDNSSAPAVDVVPVALPRMAPELALQTYQRRVAMQAAELASYSATTVIHVELPDTSQYGDYELRRHYAAPRTLQFKAVRFTGDGFVKSNIITRLLQSEVDHVQKDDTSQTAISPENYKFSYKGTSKVEERLVHMFQVKPRKKRTGLFKGYVFLDVHTGSLVRAEGRVVKPPSFFIKKIEFVQDYADISSFTLPVHIHSDARTRLVGRAVVDIYQRDYQPVVMSTQSAKLVPEIR